MVAVNRSYDKLNYVPLSARSSYDLMTKDPTVLIKMWDCHNGVAFRIILTNLNVNKTRTSIIVGN